jgi:hypothetical protein
VLAYDFTRTYELEQDEESGTYFFQVFMGTKLEKANLLIDTQANGTAINYNLEASGRGILHQTQPDKIEMPDGYAMGFDATDQLCLDDN